MLAIAAAAFVAVTAVSAGLSLALVQSAGTADDEPAVTRTLVVLNDCFAGVFDDDIDDSFAGIAGFTGFLLLLVWILAATVLLLLRGRHSPEVHA
ncbi:hypothetical protein ACI8AF_23595 [Blastococcus sp. SYSU D00669]